MEKIKDYASHTQDIIHILLGSLIITLCGMIKIPFYPVPFTMHSFAITLIGLTLSPKKAFLSAGLFLLISPDIPLCLVGKSIGFFLGFPFAAALISLISKRVHFLLAATCGQFLIYICGVSWLAPLIGFKLAITHGVLIFLASDLLKNVLAISATRGWKAR